MEQEEKDEIAQPGDKAGADIAPERYLMGTGIAECQAALKAVVEHGARHASACGCQCWLKACAD